MRGWLQGSDFKKILVKTFQFNALKMLLPLATSFLIFRSVDRLHYGFYQTLLAWITLSDLLMAGMDGSLLRFWNSHEVERSEKEAMVQLVFTFKVGITLFFLMGFGLLTLIPHFISFAFTDQALELPFFLYLWTGSLSLLVSQIQTTLGKGFIANHRFTFLLRLTLVQEIFLFLATGIALYGEASYLVLLWIRFLGDLGICCVKIYEIKKNPAGFYVPCQRYPRVFLQKVYQKYLKDYAVPITLNSVFSYVKTKLPTIVLSQTQGAGFILAGEFSFLRNNFIRIHKFLSGYLAYLLPKFVDLFEKDPQHFAQRFQKLFLVSFVLRFAVVLAFMLLFPYFFFAVNLGNTLENQGMLIFLCLELLFAEFATFNHQILLLGKDTRTVFYATLARACIEIPLSFTLTLILGLGGIGAVLTLLLARAIESWTLIRLAAPFALLKYQYSLYSACFFLSLLTLFWYREVFGV
jgi:O-antigen/teichoic acid export membrane protein